MRIQTLFVENFRAITSLTLGDLQDTVVIAGPNGCGKSCVFDAIRLLKSVYGGYQPNEWQSWFGEFQISFNQRETNWVVMFQDRNKPVQIRVQFSLSQSEKAYLTKSARGLLTDHTWKALVPELATWRYLGGTPFATNLRVHEPEVMRRVEESLPALLEEIEQPLHLGAAAITPPGSLVVTSRSLLLELVFSQYEPQHIGIIDYHGANRNYGREVVGGINLNIEPAEDRLRQAALYNYANKYANLKSEMAASYVRNLLAKEAKSPFTPDASLSDTLKELFGTFFPGKEFLGPRPTAGGGMLFPVRTPSGGEHDIDELSAGEKEVLYGYLRLRNAAPQNSVLLIDEPELHLNPRLVSGLATFYHRHLGRALGNQLWLVTHSDTLIREAVGQVGFSVFHLQPPGQYEGSNQASPVSAKRDVERLVIELVGDLAAYRPGAKIVVFEGGDDSEFDASMTGTLFPEFQARVNSISAGNRRRVADLYDILDKASSAGQIPGRFFAVTDSDGEGPEILGVTTRFRWDVYHIENYLLEPAFVLKALQDINVTKTVDHNEESVLAALRTCAAETIPTLVAHRLRLLANRTLLESITLASDPARTDVAIAISEAVDRSRKRFEKAAIESISSTRLTELEQQYSQEAKAQLTSTQWLSKFRGRDVLSRFSGKYAGGVRYEVFRNLIISSMRDADYRPRGMKVIIDQILEAPSVV